MNLSTKNIILALLKDETSYLMRRQNAKGKAGFMLYNGKQNPFRWFKDSDVSPIKDLLKKDKNYKLTLNLVAVRQQSGHTFIKKEYNKIKAIKMTLNEIKEKVGDDLLASMKSLDKAANGIDFSTEKMREKHWQDAREIMKIKSQIKTILNKHFDACAIAKCKS